MTALAILVGGVACAVTVVPLFRRGGESDAVDEEPREDRLSSQRATIYDSIRDLDFEYAMGKLTDDDYGEIRAALVRDAAVVLEEIDLRDRDVKLDDWIEAAVRERRKRGQEAWSVVCGACDHANPADASFCDACGTAIAGLCSSCNAQLRPGAAFCNNCGSSR